MNGRVAVVTGGASGIGRGIVRALAGNGMKVVVADLDERLREEAVAEVRAGGGEAIGVRCDVSKLHDVEALAEAAVAAFGAVHVLANNAGIGIPTPTHKLKLDDWEWIINVDLWGPIYGVKVFLPLIEEAGEGHITATSSMAGLWGGSLMGAYNVAKHGVVALMTTLERELRGRKSPIRASVLCPGPINTAISRHSVEYRPGQAKPKADGEREGQVARGIQNMLEAGMDPDEVGRLVRDAISNDTFWIFTHPEMNRIVTKQYEAMLGDGSLTKG